MRGGDERRGGETRGGERKRPGEARRGHLINLKPTILIVLRHHIPNARHGVMNWHRRDLDPFLVK